MQLRFPIRASAPDRSKQLHHPPCHLRLRLKAAQKLQPTEVPVLHCDEWTDSQVKAFRLAVNRSTTWAEWDWLRKRLQNYSIQEWTWL